MPQLQNITVRVTNGDGKWLQEWGVQHLRDLNDDDSSHWNEGQTGPVFVNEQGWVFKEVDTSKSKALSDRTEDVQNPKGVLVKALNDFDLSGERPQVNEERGELRQIVVKFQRVLLVKNDQDPLHYGKNPEGEEKDVDMEGASQGIAHTPSSKHARTLVDSTSSRCFKYDPYVEGEGPWPTFQFIFRSQEQLQKYNFPGFPQSLEIRKKPCRDARRIDTRLKMATPLSITHPPPPILAPKEGSVGLENTEHRYEFQDYRDPSALVTANKSKETSSTVKSSRDTEKLEEDGSLGRGTTSTVVAVKDKTRRHSKTKLPKRGYKFSSPNSSSNESSDNSPSTPRSSPIQPPTNSPTTGFYDPTCDPRLLSAPKDSQPDTFRILDGASATLPEAIDSAGETLQSECSAAVKDARYRQPNYSSDSNDAEDECSDTTEDEDEDDDGDSDKENTPMTDSDDADLHNQMKAVSLGSKRQRGEGMEELDEDEVSEREEAQAKKKMPPADRVESRGMRLRRLIAEKHAEEAALQAQPDNEEAYFEAVAVRWKVEEESAGRGGLEDFLNPHFRRD